MTRLAPLFLALLLPAPSLFAAQAPRAIWIWEKESYAIVEDTAAASAAISFLKEKKVQTLYIYADAYQGRNLIESRPDLYRKLIRRLRANGLRAYALLGSAYLHTEEYMLPAKRLEARAMFRRVLDYNLKAEPEEKFSGINLDIEPHILDQWKDRKQELLLQFLDLGREFMRLKRGSGLSIKVGPAIPFWLDGITLEWNGRKKPVSEHVLDIYDYAALMDYRDHAGGGDGIVSHAETELKYAARRGKKVVIGVETTPNDIRKVSFNHLLEADMERELALSEKSFRGEPAFAGFVIHHFRGYINWLEKQKTDKAVRSSSAPAVQASTSVPAR